MTDFEKAEFWAALGRLYDTALELTKTTQELTKTTEALRVVALSHEKRFDEIMKWIADKDRKPDQEEGRS